MNNNLWNAIVRILLLLTLSGQAINVCGAEPAIEKAKISLKKRQFPWYDSIHDRFRPLRPSESKKAKDTPLDLSWFRLGDLSGFALFAKYLMWILLALVIAIMLFVIARSAQNLNSPIDPTQDEKLAVIELETLEALPEPTRGVRDLLGEATRLAGVESYGMAMTFYFSWQLVQLNQKQLIEIQKGKTNRQYLREAEANRFELLETFRESTRYFEDVFFGNLPISREDFEHVWAQRIKFTDKSTRAKS